MPLHRPKRRIINIRTLIISIIINSLIIQIIKQKGRGLNPSSPLLQISRKAINSSLLSRDSFDINSRVGGLRGRVGGVLVEIRAIKGDDKFCLAEGALGEDDLGVDRGGHFNINPLVVVSGDVVEKKIESLVNGVFVTNPIDFGTSGDSWLVGSIFNPSRIVFEICLINRTVETMAKVRRGPAKGRGATSGEGGREGKKEEGEKKNLHIFCQGEGGCCCCYC